MGVAMFEGVLAWSLFATAAPWVPLSERGIAALLEGLGALPAGALVIELGSGDGRVLRAIVDRYPGVRGVGLEQSRILTWYARGRVGHRRARIAFRRADCFRERWESASCIVCYLLPPSMPLVAEKAMRELAPDARLLTMGFPVPGWRPRRVVAPANGEPCYEYRIGDMPHP